LPDRPILFFTELSCLTEKKESGLTLYLPSSTEIPSKFGCGSRSVPGDELPDQYA
jgi:hypothetical protein